MRRRCRHISFPVVAVRRHPVTGLYNTSALSALGWLWGQPQVTAFVPIVSGAGLLDIGMRSDIRGALEAMVGRLVTPMFVGRPAEDGSLDVFQIVNSITKMRTLHVGNVTGWPAGGKVVVENVIARQVEELIELLESERSISRQRDRIADAPLEVQQTLVRLYFSMLFRVLEERSETLH